MPSVIRANRSSRALVSSTLVDAELQDTHGSPAETAEVAVVQLEIVMPLERAPVVLTVVRRFHRVGRARQHLGAARVVQMNALQGRRGRRHGDRRVGGAPRAKPSPKNRAHAGILHQNERDFAGDVTRAGFIADR